MDTIIKDLCKSDSRSEETKTLLLLIVAGGGLYGATLGLWRSPMQALFVAIKFPLLIGLTTLGTGLINTMLAQLMGADISFRRSFLIVARSYALLVVILDSLVPLSLFLLFNLPSMDSEAASSAHSIFLLANVLLISLAGIMANIQLFASLAAVCTTRLMAMQILCSWLGINMFLGCQLSWNLRPFFGTPSLPVRFLRDHPFENSFYEAVYYTLMNLIQ